MKLNNYPSICFIAHFAYGALAGGESGHIGGVERQTSLMAKLFAKRGYKVSMLTLDEGQEDGIEIDGVKVYKMYRKNDGIKGLRFFWPQWTSLNAAMKRANADIYYQNLAECVTGQSALWCRKHGRKFVFSVSHDIQCTNNLPYKLEEKILYRYGIRLADCLIVQSQKQKNKMLECYGRESYILPMPCPGPSDIDYQESQHLHNKSNNILWLGRICKQKRPDRLIELAKICPDIQFDFVGPKDDTEYCKDIIERAKQIPNITYHGSAKREQVRDFLKQAKLLLCTSNSEGFPNTFLEAWSYGLPIVSTFDPDNIIADKGLGVVGNNISDLAEGIYKLINSRDCWDNVSHLARQYYLSNHTIETVMTQFENIFNDLI